MKCQDHDQRHHRKSVRLRNHAYRRGSYFVTICAEEREWLFGEIRNGVMALNAFGKIVEEEWTNTGHLRPYLRLDAYVVMPNHFHAIVHLNGNPPCRGTARCAPTNLGSCAPTNLGSCAPINTGTRVPATADRSFQSAIPQSLGTIIRAFKSAVTRRINLLRREPGAIVWQRNFHEHIIRPSGELAHFRSYIRDNPQHWKHDEEHFPQK